MARKTKDRIGLRYGRLLVTEKIHTRGLPVAWKCICDCGNEIFANGHNLEIGNTTSCGCFWKEAITTHGLSKSRTYGSWKAMRRRCTNPKDISYMDYGGRGITVYKPWLESFDAFLADLGECPEGHTIERINNDGNYEPSNCKWSTYKDQLNNTRHNRFIEAFGKRQTLTQWCEEFKISITTLRNRLGRAKLSPEQALSYKPYYKQRP